MHKLESLATLDQPRLRDDLTAALAARSQRLPGIPASSQRPERTAAEPGSGTRT